MHFLDSDIQKESKYFDEKEGRLLTAPLKKFKLKPFAIPSIFPNCPQYLSKPCVARETPEEKRQRIENENISRCIQESIKSHEAYRKTFHYSSLMELLNLLKGKALPAGWTYINENSKVVFLYLKYSPAPEICASLSVTQNLECTFHMNKTEVKSLNNINFPKSVNDVNELMSILEKLSPPQLKESKVKIVIDILNEIIEECEDDEKKVFEFVLDQLNLVNISKEQYRYSTNSIILFSILHTISPHAYKFLRNSGYLILPHRRTIERLCSRMPTSKDDFYLKKRSQFLEDRDKTVIIMVDEIYIKPYLDYKGGNIVGMAENTQQLATTAHVIMLQSMLSPYKEVVKILPVKNITAEDLYKIIFETIIELENLTFFVIAIVSDNNSINKKAMSFFASPPVLSITYCHPVDPSRPLFYVADTVHLLKSIRNNWINQKNDDQALYFPDFEDFSSLKLLTASFKSIKSLYEVEYNDLVKYSYGLNLKALYPTSIERQNVKLAMKIFNEYIIEGLRQGGSKYGIANWTSTAIFIEIIYKWFCIMNVKCLSKGKRLNHDYMHPLSDENHLNFKFLFNFLAWMDHWKEQKQDIGKLTRETHSALSHTTYGIIEMAKYCCQDLKFDYFLPGKVQTDSLEERFGKYRALAGSVYLISLRQLYEAETKIRLQNILPLVLKSSTYGDIISDITNVDVSDTLEQESKDSNNFEIDFSDNDFINVENVLPILVFVAGYAAYAASLKLRCKSCETILVTDKELANDVQYSFIRAIDRGSLKYPQLNVINIIVYIYILIQKLISEPNESLFLKSSNQRELALKLAIIVTEEHELTLDDCSEGHLSESIMKYLLRATINTLLNNYCKKVNDTPKHDAKRRKLATIKKN